MPLTCRWGIDPVTVLAAPQNVIFINSKDAGKGGEKSKLGEECLSCYSFALRYM